jgi:transcriptional regulator with XRE-family HTH domain
VDVSANPDEYLVVGPRSFGGAIREFRNRRRLTQQDVADRAEMHRTYLAALENGSATEAIQRIMRAMHALDLEVVIRPKQPR